jgi:hypothetical protein
MTTRTLAAEEYLPRKVDLHKAIFKKDLVTVFWGTLAGIILLVTATTKPIGLSFVDNLSAKVPNILGSLLLVSLFIERATEVFISVWRDPEADLLERELSNARVMQAKRKNEIAELLATLLESATPALKSAIETDLTARRRELAQAEEKEASLEERLVPFKARTRVVSSWMGLAIGILVAAVGFRFFHQIIDVSRLGSYTSHEGWFILVDVFLTGTILAGGAKAVHCVFALFDTFMEATRERAARSK